MWRPQDARARAEEIAGAVSTRVAPLRCIASTALPHRSCACSLRRLPRPLLRCRRPLCEESLSTSDLAALRPPTRAGALPKPVRPTRLGRAAAAAPAAGALAAPSPQRRRPARRSLRGHAVLPSRRLHRRSRPCCRRLRCRCRCTPPGRCPRSCCPLRCRSRRRMWLVGIPSTSSSGDDRRAAYFVFVDVRLLTIIK